MERHLLQRLLEKYEAGTCTDEERELLHRFFDSFERRNHGGPRQWMHSPEEVRSEIFAKLNQRIDSEGTSVKNRRTSWQAAASIVVVIGLVVAVYLRFHTPEIPIITQTTGNGERMTITLPDGSVVELNAASTLSYPESFTRGRNITLTGEAFFDVKSDPANPFIVQSGAISTTVLGTSFNVNAYSLDDEINVTVTTGRVQVASSNHSLELNSGEQAVWSAEFDSLEMKTVTVDDFVAWTEGTLRFDGASLQEVVDALIRWYGVDMTFEEPQAGETCDLKLSFNNLSLKEVMDQISRVTGIEYRFTTDKQVEIVGAGCAY